MVKVMHRYMCNTEKRQLLYKSENNNLILTYIITKQLIVDTIEKENELKLVHYSLLIATLILEF
jgi:hypothetical protein